MNATIDNVQIQVLPEQEQRVIFIDGSIVPYFMGWNEKKYSWEFTDRNTPEKLIGNENAISNLIINSEKKKTG